MSCHLIQAKSELGSSILTSPTSLAGLQHDPTTDQVA